MSNPTSVRTDSSASRGSAMEEVSLSRVLVPANIRLSQGDELEIGDFRLVVQSVWPRYSIAGKLDHWQLDLTILADGNSPMQLS